RGRRECSINAPSKSEQARRFPLQLGAQELPAGLPGPALATRPVLARKVPVAQSTGLAKYWRAKKCAQPRGRSWAREARHAHGAGREAGTADDVFRLDGGHYR